MQIFSKLVWTMEAHISTKPGGIMSMLAWITSLVLYRWVELQDPLISRVVLTLKYKCTWPGSFYISVGWRSTSSVLSLCQQQKVGGEEQQLQRRPAWGVSSHLPAHSVLHFQKHTSCVWEAPMDSLSLQSLSWNQFTRNLLSPQHRVTLSTIVWGKTVFCLF